MDSDEAVSKRSTRGRGRGTRGRARGRGRGRGRGRKVARIVSSDEESTQDPPPSVEPMEEEIIVQPPVVVPEIIPDESQKENEEIVVQKIDMEADISQLEAPTFTTIQRGPPEPMLRLKWDHKVSLIGEKVLNPMIHCCDTCLKPILIYGRMIPCKHVFCLKCARSEPVKSCPRCKEKVCRVEQSGLGTVFMCTHGGSRYGNTGCRRTYLSQRDLQAHINHRHMVPLTTTTENTINKNLITDKSGNIVQTNSLLQQRNKAETQSTNARSNVRCAPQQPPFAANLTSSISTISTRTNLITVPIQDSQQPITPVLIQQQHIPELASSNYYNSSSQQQQQQQNTYTGSSNYNASSQQNSSFSNSTNKQTITQSQQQVHNLGSRTTTVPSSGQSQQQQQQQGPAYYGQNQYNQYNQMPHYQANRQYDQQNYSNNGQSQQWNQQQYYR